MRYWAYINGEVPGSFSPEKLASVPGFTSATLVCPSEGEIDEKSWKRAGEFEDIANVLAGRAVAQSAAAPELAVAAAAAGSVAPSTDVDSMLDSAGSKLLHHVADLMKEDAMRAMQHEQVAGTDDVLRGRAPMDPAAVRVADDSAQLPNQRYDRVPGAGEITLGQMSNAWRLPGRR